MVVACVSALSSRFVRGIRIMPSGFQNTLSGAVPVQFWPVLLRVWGGGNPSVSVIPSWIKVVGPAGFEPATKGL